MAIFGKSYAPVEEPIDTTDLTEEQKSAVKTSNEKKVAEAV